MKRLRLIALVFVCCVCLALAGVGIYKISNHYLKTAGDQRCDVNQQLHRVVIQHNVVTPTHTSAKRCDQLRVTNLDPHTRLFAFGEPDHHGSYNGVSERLLAHGQSITVTLNKSGNFYFHDHLDDEHVVGTFSVTP